MEIVVLYAGAEATYVVTPEKNEGIFLANLTHYAGGDFIMPPELLLVVKSGHKWIGETGDLSLIEAIGKAIEENGGLIPKA